MKMDFIFMRNVMTAETMLELLNDDEFFKELTNSISHIYIKKVRLN